MCHRQGIGIGRIAALAILGFCASASADLPLCGYPVVVSCPGCQSYTPPGGCFCGPMDETCKCRKTTGGVQEGIKTECYTGAFDFLLDDEAPRLTAGLELDCSLNFKCKTAGGAQSGCSTYISGSCVQGDVPLCNWYPHGNMNKQPTFGTGSACNSE